MLDDSGQHPAVPPPPKGELLLRRAEHDARDGAQDAAHGEGDPADVPEIPEEPAEQEQDGGGEHDAAADFAVQFFLFLSAFIRKFL